MSDAPEEAALEIEVRRGTPDEDELAALIAVVTEGYATERATAVARPDTRSAWSLAQRALREPLRRDLGWGRFGG
ncbi:acyl-CoA carboxylase subunit epsilon [Microbacterium sp. X-17]|uniref:acyl-CoA carboxylase subunit epsilon n=1 Tax=Microbacterium sp. X-17 TaxID=3144404 RepID=UPI0031F58990